MYSNYWQKPPRPGTTQSIWYAIEMKSVFDGKATYSLEHLERFAFIVVQDKWSKEIEVNFSWHCWTRTPGDDEDVYTLTSGRERRCFCPERYALSQQLPEIIRTLAKRYVAQTRHRNFVTVEFIDEEGQRAEYTVFFHLRKQGKRKPLLLFVESAYLIRDPSQRPPQKRKRARFPLLVHKTMKGEYIKF